MEFSGENIVSFVKVWRFEIRKTQKAGETKKQKKGKDFFAADKRGLTQIRRGRKESKSLVVWEIIHHSSLIISSISTSPKFLRSPFFQTAKLLLSFLI